jgi:cysteinyl-tRNA synthetase
MDQLQAGARVAVDGAKRNPADFVLWFTRSKFGNQEMQWDSPWGRGFPGWHIECAAMATRYLGEQFDVHCGGVDHVPVHHTNEVAQAEAATGKHPWVRFWVHNEFVVFGKEKMAKSSGDFLTLSSVTERGVVPLAYRMFCFTAHYRSQLAFSWEAVEASAQSLRRLRSLVRERTGECAEEAERGAVDSALAPFRDALCDDLNVPKALATVWDIVRDQSLPPAVVRGCVAEADRVLGLDLFAGDDETACRVEVERDGTKVSVVSSSPLENSVVEDIVRRVVERSTARRERDFARSDSIRDGFAADRIELRDLPDGTTEAVVGRP